jgi:diphosphomevalonate decarboxylase
MMKATAIAPANIAFIKYWGKSDERLRFPFNPSISMNLSNTYTETTVEFHPDFTQDTIILTDGEFTEDENKRTIKSLTIIRAKANINYFARVTTKNTFPKGAGAAASASGFAALTVAAFAALDMRLSEKELTEFARLGSGSACRSIPDGFVQWDEAFAYSIHPPEYWDLRDILIIVDAHMKKVSTTDGMKTVKTSPLLAARLAALPERISRIKDAMSQKNFQQFGEIIEEECLDMHHVMQTQTPPLFYWNENTKQIIKDLKKSGLPAYFTIDAGPNVHIICEAKDEENVRSLFEKQYQVIINRPAKGAHTI